MKKITRVKFYNHPVLKDSEINLVDKTEFNNQEYISLIIGQIFLDKFYPNTP